MIADWAIGLTAALYLAALFGVASWGDGVSARARAAENAGQPWFARPPWRAALYSLTLGVYCTSWTLYGSVGLASREGWTFVAIYVGPILVFVLASAFLSRIVRLAKAHNISSVADFIAARHGKNPRVAAAVALIALAGSLPYIALQLKAVTDSLTLLAGGLSAIPAGEAAPEPARGASLGVAVAMALFAILFGTRSTDATQHQDGLMLAVAAESVVKLLAFLLVGAFVTFGMFDGVGDLVARAAAAGVGAPLREAPPLDLFLAMTGLALICALLLPRQFHAAVVEARAAGDLRVARWLFPVYLVLINLFVVPIALAGLLTFGQGGGNGDLFVLSLPMQAGSEVMTVIAFLGGLSAATAMVIVASVSLAIMLSNDVIAPVALRLAGWFVPGRSERVRLGGARAVLSIRRAAIVVVLLMGFAYERATSGGTALASIGLVSFAAIAQLAPAFLGGLLWRGGTSGGALAGLTVGISLWAYTLLLPNFAASGMVPIGFVENGPFGIDALRPQALLGLDIDPLAHSVLWSLGLNALAYALVSRLSQGRGVGRGIERVQAALFVPRDGRAPRPRRARVTVGEVEALVGRYLGDAAAARTLRDAEPNLSLGQRATPAVLNAAERLLASAVGAASSRALLSFLLSKGDVSHRAALQLLDDASAGLQESRGILQNALDEVAQGIAVFDVDMRLRAWNKQFVSLLRMPDSLVRPGTTLMNVLRHNAEHGQYGSGPVQARLRDRMEQIVVRQSTLQERRTDTGAVIEVRTALLPQGGLVATYTDVTETVDAAAALAEANTGLEARVQRRTREVEAAKEEAEQAQAQAEAARRLAEAANAGKTRFLAAASHDLMQPLSAARLYVEALRQTSAHEGGRDITAKIDASLGAVEDILVTLIDISKLDAGALKPAIAPVDMNALLTQIETEFQPMAAEKRLRLRVAPTSLWVTSDARLLLRLLRNLVSNALKYTQDDGTGTVSVLVGVRRRGRTASIEVHDQGLGIPEGKRADVFQEFQRLEAGARMSEGLGLGLSIVQRLAGVLQHELALASEVGRGTSITLQASVSEAPAVETAEEALDLTGLRGLSVLCVDNEPDILTGLSRIMAGWGVRVITARSRAEALDALAGLDAAPDALLLDYHLPGDDGLSIGEALPAPGAARVLVSAARDPAIVDAAKARGFLVLHKPIKPARLRAVLSRIAAAKTSVAAE